VFRQIASNATVFMAGAGGSVLPEWALFTGVHGRGILRSWTSVLGSSRKLCKLRGLTKSATPHARQLRQNRAANATWTGRAGIRTPEKAGSVSKETHPSGPDASTRTPSTRDAFSKTMPRPTAVKATNSRIHQSGSHQSNPSNRPSTVPTNPTGKPTLRRGRLPQARSTGPKSPRGTTLA
jgi:hypothetical protein